MGVLGTEYLRLSPGELERYTKEASREVRLKRLHEARRQASLLAQQQLQSNQHHRRVEEKALKTVEVRAELAAKRVQLQGLLKLKEACVQENAMESARLRQVEDEARRCAAEALEAERQKQEALRCLEACRQRKAWQSLKAEEAAVRQKQRQEVKAMERRRAQRAASLGRATKEAEKLVEKRWEDEKVLKTDVSGLQQLSKTCVQVFHEVMEAEEQPRRPAPEPSPAQREAARSRGLAAQQQLRAEREEKDAERERRAKEKKERQNKAAAVAARAREAASWADELLPWRILNTSKDAEEQLAKILAPDPSAFNLRWLAPRAKARPRSQAVRKRSEQCSRRPKTAAPKAQPLEETQPSTVTWLGPATVWPTVGVAEEDEVVEDQSSDVQCKAEALSEVPEPDAKEKEMMEMEQNDTPASSPGPRDATPVHPPVAEKRILLPARPSRQPRKLGEEDLALRLDDICRELEEVGLCAWEADEDIMLTGEGRVK